MHARSIPVAARAIAIRILLARLRAARTNLLAELCAHFARRALILFRKLVVASNVSHRCFPGGTEVQAVCHLAGIGNVRLQPDRSEQPNRISDADDALGQDARAKTAPAR